MIDRRIGKIKLRRGTDQERQTIVFAEGELIYTIDDNRGFVGDGVTTGGLPISNKNFIVTSISPLPSKAIYCDIIHNITDSTTYIVGSASNGSLSAILMCDIGCCNKLREDIDEVKKGINDVLTIVSNFRDTPEEEEDVPFKFVIQPTDQSVNYGGTATFTASAVGGGIITYQWYKSNTIINSAIGTTLVVSNVDVYDIGDYKCVATSSKLGPKDSNIANLSVDSKLILANPNREYILSNPTGFFIEYTEASLTGLLLEDPTSDYLYTNDGVYIQIG